MSKTFHERTKEILESPRLIVFQDQDYVLTQAFSVAFEQFKNDKFKGASQLQEIKEALINFSKNSCKDKFLDVMIQITALKFNQDRFNLTEEEKEELHSMELNLLNNYPEYLI